MAYTPYQPYGGYYQQGYPTYIPHRSDAPQNMPQAPQNSPQSSFAAPAIQSAPSMQSGFICRPVTSREEAVAIQTDFMSPGTLMPDFGHGMVYFKRFNSNTGLSDWLEFALVQPKQEENVSAPPADQTDALKTFGEQLAAISARLDDMSGLLEAWKPKTSRKGAADE